MRDRLFLEEHRADLVIEVAHLLDEVLIGLSCQLLVVGRNVVDRVGGTDLVVIRVDDGLLVDDVDLALEVVFRADRNEDRPGIGAELLAHAVHGAVKVRAGAVHLVDERDARNAVFGRLAPDGLRLRLHAGHAAEDGDRAVEHAQRTLHLGGEVHVAGRVDDVDPLFEAFKNLEDALLLALLPRQWWPRR